jgi:hypothetical protein
MESRSSGENPSAPVLPKWRALECIVFAASVNGDKLIFHPRVLTRLSFCRATVKTYLREQRLDWNRAISCAPRAEDLSAGGAPM